MKYKEQFTCKCHTQYTDQTIQKVVLETQAYLLFLTTIEMNTATRNSNIPAMEPPSAYATTLLSAANCDKRKTMMVTVHLV